MTTTSFTQIPNCDNCTKSTHKTTILAQQSLWCQFLAFLPWLWQWHSQLSCHHTRLSWTPPMGQTSPPALSHCRVWRKIQVLHIKIHNGYRNKSVSPIKIHNGYRKMPVSPIKIHNGYRETQVSPIKIHKGYRKTPVSPIKIHTDYRRTLVSHWISHQLQKDTRLTTAILSNVHSTR